MYIILILSKKYMTNGNDEIFVLFSFSVVSIEIQSMNVNNINCLSDSNNYLYSNSGMIRTSTLFLGSNLLSVVA